MVGYIPSFLSEDNPEPAAKQFNANYAHGGGWQPMKGWTFSNGVLSYPGDPQEHPVAKLTFRDETIYVYNHAWVCIVQANSDFEVARMD